MLRVLATLLLCLALAAPAAAFQSASTSSKPAPTPTVVNLNTATVAQIATLPGIGEKTAQRIVEHREKSGGFKKVEELMNIKGIGEKSFLKIKPLITVEAKPAGKQ